MDAEHEDKVTAETAEDGLRKVLNKKGYGFQYATLKKCLESEIWRYAVDEYPVDLHDEHVHIDFVLGFEAHLLVAECKRIDGWRWGFARGATTVRGPLAARPRADFLQWNNNLHPASLEINPHSFGPENASTMPFDVAVELKVHGDSEKSPKAFDDALKQVLRGRGGLIKDLCGRGDLRYKGGAVVPVIFTNAELVGADAQLASADLLTGDLKRTDGTVAECLWFDHPMTKNLRPHVPFAQIDPPPPTKTEALQRSLNREMIRSVAVVNVGGIRAFLHNLANSLGIRVRPIL